MRTLYRVLDIAGWVVIADVVMRWVIGPDAFPRTITDAVMNPVYAPFRALLRGLDFGGLDLAPLLLLVLLQVGQWAIKRRADW